MADFEHVHTLNRHSLCGSRRRDPKWRRKSTRWSNGHRQVLKELQRIDIPTQPRSSDACKYQMNAVYAPRHAENNSKNFAHTASHT